MNITEKQKEKFWSNIDISNDANCWNWSASCSQGGYGQIDINSKVYRTHRLAYILSKGIIPEGLLVIHSCDNRKCCNPNHLRIGTAKDNTNDMYARSREVNLKGKDHQYFGKKRSKETCNKISKSRTGIVFTEETKKKMSAAKIGKRPPNFGKRILSQDYIKEIKILISERMAQHLIAKLYGVSQIYISRINRGIIA